MPVDEAGNRADMVMDGYATVNRMNLGRSYELYVNAASRDVVKKIISMLNITDKKHVIHFVEDLFHTNKRLFDQAIKYLLGYYKIIAPRMFNWYSKAEDQVLVEHLAEVIKDGIYLYIPPDNEINAVEAITELEKFYKPTYGPVTYIGNSGRKVTTKDPVRIGSVYVMLLEKTGEDWSSVASGKVQHFGILAKIAKPDTYAQPTRSSPIRAWGESEARIVASYCPLRTIAELMDRNNNPATHKEIVKGILEADKPTNITTLIDRQKIPYGQTKPLSLVKHTLFCAGIKFHYHKTN